MHPKKSYSSILILCICPNLERIDEIFEVYMINRVSILSYRWDQPYPKEKNKKKKKKNKKRKNKGNSQADEPSEKRVCPGEGK